jgi:HlyD family secretion protein
VTLPLRWGWAALFGTVAFLVALPLWRGFGADSDVPSCEVLRGEFVRRVHADGLLQAAEATVLSPPSSTRGSLRIGWLAPDGSRVHEGDVVIRFDPTDLEEKLAEGENQQAATDSRITQKQVREDSAVRNLERDADMAVLDLEYAREFQSKDALIFSRIEIIESEIDEELATQRKEHAEAVREIREDLAQVELDLLDIERRKADLQVEEARRELQELEVRAPHDGIFVLKEQWGRMPEVGQMVWRGNPVAEIPRPEVMEAKVYVLEADAGGLRVGAPATVVLDAHPGRVYEAKVKQVDALAQPRSWRVPVQYFGVVLELELTEPERMKPGQRVQAELSLDELSDVLSVPRQAIFEKDGRSVVYVGRGGRFEPVPVELGATGLGRVVVLEGLEEGDRVALRDPTRPLRAPAEEEGAGGVSAGPSGSSS